MKKTLLFTILFCAFAGSAYAQNFICKDDTGNVQVSILNLSLSVPSQPILKILMFGYSNGENGEMTSATVTSFKGSAVIDMKRTNGEVIHLITNPNDQKDGTAQWKRANGSVIENLFCSGE